MSFEVVDIAEPVEEITAVFDNIINVLVMNSLDDLEFSQLVYGVYRGLSILTSRYNN